MISANTDILVLVSVVVLEMMLFVTKMCVDMLFLTLLFVKMFYHNDISYNAFRKIVVV